MAENIFVPPGTVYYPGLFDTEVALTIAEADKRYIKKGSDASYNLVSASNRLEVESANNTSITSSSNCNQYGLHLHSVLNNTNGRYAGSSIAFNNSLSDSVPLSSISLDKISANVGELVFGVRFGSDCSERLRITNDGLNVVGALVADQIILNSGVTDADWFTQVQGDARYVRANNASGSAMTGALTINRTTSGNSFTSINGTSECRLYHFNNGNAVFGTTSANNLQFQTGGNIRSTVTSAGDIGINTTTPEQRFHVVGNIRCQGTLIPNVISITNSGTTDILTALNSPMTFKMTSFTNAFVLGTSTEHPISFQTNGLVRGSVTSSGLLDWGTNNVRAECFVSESSTNDFPIFSNTNGTANFQMRSFNNAALIGMISNHTLSFMTNSSVRGSITPTGSLNWNHHVYINGSSSNTVPANRRYGSSGSDPSNQAGGTVPLSLRTSSNVWIAGDMYSSSDRRLKTNINKWDSSKCMNLLQVDPCTYSWRSDESGNLCLGFIAQDLIANDCTDLVQCFETNDEDIGHCDETNMDGRNRYVVEYQKIPLYLLEIIKKQQRDIDMLIELLPKTKRDKWAVLDRDQI